MPTGYFMQGEYWDNWWNSFGRSDPAYDPANYPAWDGWALPDWLKTTPEKPETVMYDDPIRVALGLSERTPQETRLGTIALVGVAFVLGMVIFGR